jgi:outer membrane protein assembly factor BamE (lipoprotein component of BamABCDE complex)
MKKYILIGVMGILLTSLIACKTIYTNNPDNDSWYQEQIAQGYLTQIEIAQMEYQMQLEANR